MPISDEAQRREACTAILAVKAAFNNISDPVLAVDLATIVMAEILVGAPAEHRPEVAKHFAVQAILLLEHLEK